MKKFKLALSNGSALTFSWPDLSLKNNRKLQVLLKLLVWAQYIFLFSFSFALPFVGYFGEIGTEETSYFRFTVISILILLVLFIPTAILNHKERFIDPKNFLTVLFFALLTTTSSVLVTPSGISNTFGTTAVRSLGGVTTMALIGLFYFINLNILDLKSFRKYIYIFTGSLSLFVLFAVLMNTETNANLMNYILGFSPLFVLLPALISYTKKYKTFNAVLLIITLVVAVTLIRGLNISSIKSFVYILMSLFISSLAVVSTLILNNKEFFSKRFNELKSEKINSNQILSLLILASPVIILLMLVYIMGINKLDFNIFVSPFASMIKTMKYPFTSGGVEMGRLMFGYGGTVLNSAENMITNVIYAQGYIGLWAYLFLGVIAVYQGFKTLLKTFNKTTDYKLIAGLVALLVFISALSLFIYPGIFLVITWWISFSLISLYSLGLKAARYIEDWDILNININGKSIGKKGLILKIVLMIISVLMVVSVIHGFNILKL